MLILALPLAVAMPVPPQQATPSAQEVVSARKVILRDLPAGNEEARKQSSLMLPSLQRTSQDLEQMLQRLAQEKRKLPSVPPSFRAQPSEAERIRFLVSMMRDPTFEDLLTEAEAGWRSWMELHHGRPLASHIKGQPMPPAVPVGKPPAPHEPSASPTPEPPPKPLLTTEEEKALDVQMRLRNYNRIRMNSYIVWSNGGIRAWFAEARPGQEQRRILSLDAFEPFHDAGQRTQALRQQAIQQSRIDIKWRLIAREKELLLRNAHAPKLAERFAPLAVRLNQQIEAFSAFEAALPAQASPEFQALQAAAKSSLLERFLSAHYFCQVVWHHMCDAPAPPTPTLPE